MICNRCGRDNNETSKFCMGCGNPLFSQQPMNNYQQPMYNQPMNSYQQPMYNQQFVSGKPNGNNVGLIIGIVVAVVVVLCVIGFMSTPTSTKSKNPVSGTWDCKSFDGTGANGDYIITFRLNKDKTFRWEKYNDGTANYVKGTYTYDEVVKSNNNTGYKYYKVNIDGDEYVNAGVRQTQDYNSEYEIGILTSGDKRQAVMMNVSTYRMYYCYER